MLRKITIFLILSYFCLNPISFHLPKNEGTLGVVHNYLQLHLTAKQQLTPGKPTHRLITAD